MPVDYEIDSERRLVRVRCSGDVTFAVLMAGRPILVADPAFRPDFALLFDCLEVPRSVLSVAEVGLLVDNTDFDSRVRFAIVVQHIASYGLGRMFQIRREAAGADSERIRIFRNRDDAEAWLGTAY